MTKETDARGLILVYTGDGKGKTTAALGALLRSAGHGYPCCMIQFIKSRADIGESLLFAAGTLPTVEFLTMGRGFVFNAGDRSEHESAARAAFAKACEVIDAGKVRLLVLDEITHAINLNLLDAGAVVAALKKRPVGMHIIVTGRNCPAEILAIADLVSEVRNVRHPYDQGIVAQKGIDY